MEDNKILEQPNVNSLSNNATAYLENSAENNTLGSKLGKFTDENQLLSSYNNLEKEFTKKCQKLKEVEKSLKDNTNCEIQVDNSEIEDNSNNSMENTQNVPKYELNNWNNNISDFLNKFPDAKNYVKDIAQILFEDKVLAGCENSLEYAYNKVLSNKYEPKEVLIKNEEFLNNYVYNNDEIKNYIIKQYLEDVNFKKTPPVVLNTNASTVGFTSEKPPKNLKEAMQMASLYFK